MSALSHMRISDYRTDPGTVSAETKQTGGSDCGTISWWELKNMFGLLRTAGGERGIKSKSSQGCVSTDSCGDLLNNAG